MSLTPGQAVWRFGYEIYMSEAASELDLWRGLGMVLHLLA